MTALEIAKYFIAKPLSDDEELLSHLKLQKLLYYAQGFWLALNDGRALFDEPVLAWEHGPVVRSVWENYRAYRGGEPIPAEPIDLDEFDPEIQDILDEVWRVYGQFSAWKLREMTHAEPPWRDTPRNAEIPQPVMKDFFSSLLPG